MTRKLNPIASSFLLFLGNAAAALAGENSAFLQPPITPPLPAASLPASLQVMADLQAANAARTAYEAALADNESEEARTKVLLQMLADGKARAEQEAAAAQAECARIRGETAGMASAIDALKELETAAGKIAYTVRARLLPHLSQTFPGAVANCDISELHCPTAAADSFSAEQNSALTADFHALVATLDALETAGQEWSTEIASGQINAPDSVKEHASASAEIAVRLLRAGDAAAWWLSMDGTQAGTAVMEDGRLLLYPAASAAERETIARAFAAHSGQTAPEWLPLPIRLRASITKNVF